MTATAKMSNRLKTRVSGEDKRQKQVFGGIDGVKHGCMCQSMESSMDACVNRWSQAWMHVSIDLIQSQ
jgi:hypothetical protein